MWLKSLIAPLWGFALAVSLLTMMRQLRFIAADTMLLVGLIGLFVLWAGIMVYCYSRNSIYQASISLSKVFAITLLVNIVLLFS